MAGNHNEIEKRLWNAADMESIFSAATGDVVQLMYTWLVSHNVLRLKQG